MYIEVPTKQKSIHYVQHVSQSFSKNVFFCIVVLTVFNTHVQNSNTDVSGEYLTQYYNITHA